MAKTTKTRWVCEKCGTAVMGSRRPRLDATIRFCLPCSAKSDRLVKREAPVLERERLAKSAKAADAARLRAAREREKAARPWVVEGIDLRPYVRRYQTAIAKLPGRSRYPAPFIETPRRRAKPWSTGTCYGWRIVLTFGTEYGDAAATLLHELVHSHVPAGEHHGHAWVTAFMAAARVAHPRANFRFDELPLAPTKQQVQAAIARGIAEEAGTADATSGLRGLRLDPPGLDD